LILPDAAADGPLFGAQGNPTFPGWAGHPDYPREEISFLTQGLLAI
jgi:hypothetical protein